MHAIACRGDHLLVDPSVASRMVSDCISHAGLDRATARTKRRQQTPATASHVRLDSDVALLREEP
jgi:hypothetical protein